VPAACGRCASFTCKQMEIEQAREVCCKVCAVRRDRSTIKIIVVTHKIEGGLDIIKGCKGWRL
jgi:hypothetical protein